MHCAGSMGVRGCTTPTALYLDSFSSLSLSASSGVTSRETFSMSLGLRISVMLCTHKTHIHNTISAARPHSSAPLPAT